MKLKNGMTAAVAALAVATVAMPTAGGAAAPATAAGWAGHHAVPRHVRRATRRERAGMRRADWAASGRVVGAFVSTTRRRIGELCRRVRGGGIDATLYLRTGPHAWRTFRTIEDFRRHVPRRVQRALTKACPGAGGRGVATPSG